ncbi:hypothetical protein K6V72_19460 [Ralstonia insidiosa]|uniref:Uncharacterized protein n=1 Tax=Ralstonia insidiosa TaxID=190721 RepID=A0A191ZYY2_9RALS|nr:hypothetical protein [Ralstonia insidiosa]ANJ73334.1 hypothetical protein A9Y76_13005 [Ralstonia insidiosa]KAB0473703.1 hypothetical protein F7R11_14555 [Ralstonia insidiosa]MBY4911199.1 hypothetical protein [Ralstonia insidiosa]
MQTVAHQHAHRRNFATDTTLFRTTTLAAVALLNLIRLFTNLFFFQTLSLAEHSPSANTLGLWAIVVPVIGGLIVGLMARWSARSTATPCWQARNMAPP